MSHLSIQFLKEATDNPKKVEISEKRYNQLIEKLEKFESDGELIQSEFKSLSETFGYYWDLVRDYNGGIKSIIPRVAYNEQTELESAMDDLPFGRTGLNKYARLLKKASAENEKPENIEVRDRIIPIIDEMIGFNDRLNALKKCVVKKKKADVNKAVSAEKEEARRANHKDTIKAQAILNEMMEKEKPALVESLRAGIKHDVLKMKTFLSNTDSVIDAETTYRGRRSLEQPDYKKAQLKFIACEDNPFEYYDRTDTHERHKVNVASEEVITDRVNQLANEQAKFLIDQYVHKVSSKLGYFFVKKDPNESLEKIEKLNISLLGNIDATLAVTFNDGSKFDLHTQTVWAQNPVNDGYHIKVPTRFTNAYKADGTKIKSPSEKRVQDELTM